MALIRTKHKPRNGPLFIRRGGKVYGLSERKIKIPTLDAINMLGDKSMHIEFTAEDKNTISRLSPRRVEVLARGLNRPPDLKGIMRDLFPRSRSKKVVDAVKSVTPKIPVVEKPKKPVIEKIEEKESEVEPPLCCTQCGKELTGKQKKFCSRQCSSNNKKMIKAKHVEAMLDDK